MPKLTIKFQNIIDNGNQNTQNPISSSSIQSEEVPEKGFKKSSEESLESLDYRLLDLSVVQ